MTAAANLFPQALHAPASLEWPLPYNTMLTMNSGLGFFAKADYNDDNRDPNLKVTGNIV